MSASTVQPPLTVDPPLPRKLFTAPEVEQMLESGIFAGQRFELIDGELIDKIGQEPAHATAIGHCMCVLAEIFGIGLVHVQAAMEAGPQDRECSVPEPDLFVVIEDKPDFARRHPTGLELRLAVEVSDTTLCNDALKKRDLYARAGVPEYWVLDLNGRRLLVHRDLNGATAEYASIWGLREGEAVTVGSEPGKLILVSSLLP